MRKPVNTQPPGIETAFPIARHKHGTGITPFYIPPTLESDFGNW